MNNNKGFISMSLVYSFLIVFVTISASLLAIYTENISDIRRLNTEIKDELIERGNDQVIVLENLVTNGTFAPGNAANTSTNWRTSNNTRCAFSKKDIQAGVQTGQSYYDDGSIEIRTAGGACNYTSQQPIVMKQNHIYYVEMLYNSGQGYGEGNDDVRVFFITDRNGNPTTSSYVVTDNISADKPYMSGWTMPSGSGAAFQMGTVVADVFKFTPATPAEGRDYYIGLTFSDTTKDQPTYMDGLMLIDITQAIGATKANTLCGTATGSKCGNSTAKAQQIWRLKSRKVKQADGSIQYTNEGFYDGRKVFSAFDPDSIK